MDTRTLILTILLLTAGGLAGCIEVGDQLDEQNVGDLAGDVTVPPVPDFDFAHAIDPAHEHQEADLHGASFHLDLAAFVDLREGLEPWAVPSGYSEVDVEGDLAVVAGVEGNRAFTLLDVSDPAEPQVLSHFYSWGENWDARISDDGRWVFVGCQGGTPGGAYSQRGGVGACQSPSGIAPTDPSPNGIMAVDISDRKDPRLAAFTTSGPVHNLDTITLDDGTVLVANNAIELFTFDPDRERFDLAAEIDGTHDVHFQVHLVTNETLLYTGTQDLTIYRVDDPRDPELVAALEGSSGDFEPTAWHEQTPAPALIDGRAILLGAGERSDGLPGPVTVYDITDPAEPEILGSWMLPVEVEEAQGSYKFSVHNIDVTPTGQVAVGMYHGGVWVFDASTTARMRSPVTLAFHEPVGELVVPPQATPYGLFVETPYVWGAQWADTGHLLVPDMNTGLHVLEPGFWDDA